VQRLPQYVRQLEIDWDGVCLRWMTWDYVTVLKMAQAFEASPLAGKTKALKNKVVEKSNQGLPAAPQEVSYSPGAERLQSA
jgi:hypothetical protein